jgi:hypothetical protein
MEDNELQEETNQVKTLKNNFKVTDLLRQLKKNYREINFLQWKGLLLNLIMSLILVKKQLVHKFKIILFKAMTFLLMDQCRMSNREFKGQLL